MILKLLARGLLPFLLLVPGAARADWYEVGTSHFVVYSDDRPDRIESFATDLERFDQALRALWNISDPAIGDANRVTVYVVSTTGKVAKLAGDSDVAGFYRGRAGGSLAIVPRRSGNGDAFGLDAMTILLHEYTHHFMETSWPNAAYPSWFIEGFAEFHATARMERDGSVTIGLAPQYRGYGLLNGPRFPLRKLLVAESQELSGADADALYGHGWLLTHYLMLDDTRPRQLTQYLLAINQGKEPLTAATEVFGDLRTLDRELDKYKHSRFGAKQIPPSMLKVGKVTTRKLTDGEAATMSVRIVSKNGVTSETAPKVYEDAKRAAAPYPNDPGAQIMLAEAAYDADDYAGAEAACDRALAVNPKAVDALLYKARARIQLAIKAKDRSPTTIREIRKLIAAANAADPDDPEPMILFYRSYAEFGMKPSRNALDAFYSTFLIAPYDTGLRVNVAMAYANDGKAEQAKLLLRPLIYDPHSKELAQESLKLIEMIEKGTLGADGDEAGASDEADEPKE